MCRRILLPTLLALLAFVAPLIADPSIVSPSSGATLPGSTVEFEWSNQGSTIVFYHLNVGSTLGGEDYFRGIFDPDEESITVSSLPTDGSGVFARLFYMLEVNGGYAFRWSDYTYSTPLPSPPTLTSPTPNSSLAGSSATFKWQDNGTAATQYRLQVGSTIGGSQYFDQELAGASREQLVTGLPQDGSTVRVRLSYYFINVWRQIDYQYTAALESGDPLITAPAFGETVTTAPFVIQWDPNQGLVDKWQVLVGLTAGAGGILDTGEVGTDVRSTTVSTFPAGENVFFIRLRWLENGVWSEKDTQYTYDPNGDAAPQVFNPPAGSEIVGSSATFEWTPKAIPVDEWWIYVGLAPGDDSIFNQVMGADTSVTVNNLPSDGQNLYVRLFYRVGEVWNQRDHLYITRRQPKMSFPTPGTKISGPHLTFEWDDNDVIGNAWSFTIGRNQGGSEIFDTGTLFGETRSQQVNLPVNISGPVWVRLWHLPNSFTWSFADFLYDAQSASEPALLEPLAGSTLTGGGDFRFFFSNNDTTLFAYWVYVGSTIAGRDLFNSGLIADNANFVDVLNLPNEDQQIHVRLWWLAQVGQWSFADYTLKLAKSSTPGVTPPTGTIPVTPPVIPQ